MSPAVSVSREDRNSFDDSDGELSVAEPQRDRENANSFDIPIFTEEFLDHNKARELELKQLRKQTSEFEEQNAVLGKHIESMKSAISKLEVRVASKIFECPLSKRFLSINPRFIALPSIIDSLVSPPPQDKILPIETKCQANL